jgi:MSHA biogenesis protein MshJ
VNGRAAFSEGANRFNRLSVRERVLASTALLASVFILWDSALMRPLTSQQKALSQELADAEAGIKATADAMDNGAASESERAALARQQALQTRLDAAVTQLTSAEAGLIPPQRMVEVIRDVLSHREGLRLISLRSAPVRTLLPSTAAGPVEAPPYVHPVELIIEGSYADVLAYLQSLESLPWHFYWKTLELTTVRYPNNRVRIELMTLSMDKAWVGV